MVGKFEAFLDKAIDRDRSMLTRTLVRMQQHILDNSIRTLAMLDDLVEIAP